MEVSDAFLLENSNDQMVAAQLFDDISDTHLEAWREQWCSVFEQAVSQSGTPGTGQLVPEDAHWQWDRILETVDGLLAYKRYSVVCNDRLQGMMLVNMSKTGRVAEQLGKVLVYIERLATAPWNRKSIVSHPLYKGVGRLLIAAAVKLSLQEELKGRIGLHSLPHSEGFYKDACGMTDLGSDPKYKGLHYFEMTERQAHAFLSI